MTEYDDYEDAEYLRYPTQRQVFLGLLPYAVAGLVAIGTAAWLLMSEASAHQAPTGWQYDYSCCTTVDCRQVSTPKKVSETRNGYVVPSGELIPYNDRRIKVSKDEFFHWCTQQGKDDTKVICLYVPNRGF